ncbi:Dimethylaniline monooxygenase [N-oxide-forming] 5 [Liparis tanakae]|uniref:Flavin-containing monooxygenase n=1 Tax=Liparis tanakae TaxID=230148 RepID=A0A4Z2FYY7_9TELE|nr:Dimethylaniline monooxygenase [N-oxide-forming] 5 [Liparis tanakae]
MYTIKSVTGELKVRNQWQTTGDKSQLRSVEVDAYMDDIAEEVGVRPSLLWLFFTDYSLFQRVLWGPVTAYQYRLKGPGKWEGARRAILTQLNPVKDEKGLETDAQQKCLAMVRRVAVVGAGNPGLVCIKVCLDEGLEPVCFESSDDIGGLWKYKYFRLYADHFDLLRYVRFQTTVKSITQRPDFSTSGQWDVVTANGDGVEENHVFDAVMVCSGSYTEPALPLSDFPGNEMFAGRCLHSQEFKNADAYRGKRAVVVGIGNSGGDIAVEISRSAEKTFLSTRQGSLVVGRMCSNGLPLDMVHISRLNNVLTGLLPKSFVNGTAERGLNSRFDHRLYGLKPKHRVFDQKLLINDDLPSRILQGALVMKPNVKVFTTSGVVFEDGTVEENIDTVVFCTGYIMNFPFLPPALSEGPHKELTLYKSVGGLSLLPQKKNMLEVIESERRRNMKRIPCPRKAALQVDYIPYLDFMAEQVGVRPNIFSLLLRDPVLWFKVFLGTCTPYQYRLTGPGKWAGARRAILTQTREVPEPENQPSVLFSPWLLVSAGAVTIAIVLSKNDLAPVLQGVARYLDQSKIFLLDFTVWSR